MSLVAITETRGEKMSNYEDVGICPECKEHCTFIRTDEDGNELSPEDEGYDEAEALSECCGW